MQTQYIRLNELGYKISDQEDARHTILHEAVNKYDNPVILRYLNLIRIFMVNPHAK